MKPGTENDEARLAKARFDLLFAQLDHNLCQAREAAARIAAIKALIKAKESSGQPEGSQAA